MCAGFVFFLFICVRVVLLDGKQNLRFGVLIFLWCKSRMLD